MAKQHEECLPGTCKCGRPWPCAKRRGCSICKQPGCRADRCPERFNDAPASVTNGHASEKDSRRDGDLFPPDEAGDWVDVERHRAALIQRIVEHEAVLARLEDLLARDRAELAEIDPRAVAYTRRTRCVASTPDTD